MSNPNAQPEAPSPEVQAHTPLPKQFDVGDTLGLPQFRGIPIYGYDRPWNHLSLKTPRRKPSFVWDEDLVRTFIMFWIAGGDEIRAMKLIGHTGAGKTEGVLQWHAAFNLPLLMVGANPRTEAQQLTGMPVVTPQGAGFVDGPLVTAARTGSSILIDEYNLIDPGEASGLNAFLEGKPYTVPETGETIVPAPGFRIFVTMNPKTAGYRGRQMQDMANDERFIDHVVQYLPPEVETPLVLTELKRCYSHLQPQPDEGALCKVAEQHVKFANLVRGQYMGVNDSGAALPCTMSTRTLLRWVSYTVAAKLLIPSTESAAHYALRKVLSNRQQPDVAEALHATLTSVIGEAERRSPATS